MKNTFIQMTDAYRKHFYPKGYFASYVSPVGGVVIVICGLVLALIGCLPATAVYFIFQDYLEGKTNLTTVIFFALLATAFLAGGGFVIYLGVRKIRMKEEDYIRECAETCGYPESVVREIGAQIVEPDTLRLELAGDKISGKGFLTRDFIMQANAADLCGIKISDISKAYFTKLPHPTARYGDCLWLMLYSNRDTLVSLEVFRKEDGDRLVSMLLEKNPAIQINEKGR